MTRERNTPPPHDQMIETALRLHRQGAATEAIAALRTVLCQAPAQVDALHLLGALVLSGHAAAPAVYILRWAMSAGGETAAGLVNFGAALTEMGRPQEAETALRRAITLDPASPLAWNNLATALRGQRRFAEALAALDHATVLAPDFALAWRLRAETLLDLGRPADAIATLQPWLERMPDDATARHLTGVGHHRQGETDAAITWYRQALALQPDKTASWANLGLALLADGVFDDAITTCRHAIRLDPEEAGAHNNLSMALLLAGRMEEGLREHEWRLHLDHFLGLSHAGRRWNGEDLDGGTLLVVAEQGLGDTLQFIRFARQARDRVGRLILECPPALASVAASARGVDAIVPPGTAPACDAWVPLLSLPLLLGLRDVAAIPAWPSYLSAPAEARERWRPRLDQAGPGLRVGLIWGGNPEQPHNYRRSAPLSALAPLVEVPGVRFFSLQMGAPAAELARSELADRITDLTPMIVDFGDTAAIMSQLDLVISVCTSSAHLAGALGVPTWVLLSHVADWRWFLDREDSPWYPSARLFRQPAHGDWNSVAAAVAAALPELTRRQDQADASV
ncbi:Tetratricopeptide repeat protein [Candidatus Terasakiella magnetica]|nr:Tetratricopeptide repeat protein [Candidatus Terasakiella magnetica]